MELHRHSIVCDLYGCVNINHRVGLYSHRMRQWALAELAREPDPAKKRQLIKKIRVETRKMRPVEIAQDPGLQGDYAAIWDASGITVGIESTGRTDSEVAPFPELVKQMARSNYVCDNVEWLERLTDLNKVQNLKAQGKHGLMFHCSKPDAYFGGPQIEDPVEALNLFYALGIRASQLTNSTKNQVGTSHYQDHDAGLTDLGRAVVGRMNELGMVVDLSHSGNQTSLDAIKTSKVPVIASHSACRSVSSGGKSKNRNITDEALKVLAERGGMVGIPNLPNLLGDFGIGMFFKHLDYAVKLVGIDHVGIGSDNGGIGVCTSLPTTPHLVVGRSACRVGVGPSLNRSWAQRSRPVVQAGRRAFPGDESVVD